MEVLQGHAHWSLQLFPFLSPFPSRLVVYQIGTEGINSSLGRREELILYSSCLYAACPASLQLPSLGSK